MADDVEVKFGADTGGVDAGVKQLLSQLDTLLSPIKGRRPHFPSPHRPHLRA